MTYLTGKVMTGKLISIIEDRDIITAESLMKTYKIRHLPVVNSENELSGILSIRDVIKAKDKTSQVKTVMTTPVRTVKKNANIKTVIELMLKYKISAVLVADNEDVAGIVTTDDLLKLLHQVLEDGENLESIEIASLYDEDWSGNFAH
ncbi:MAG: CBS domain-containing protein [Pseudobdellovibrio sp.]